MTAKIVTGFVVFFALVTAGAFFYMRTHGRALTAAERGERLAVRAGCMDCHQPGNVLRAPKLEGLYGRDVQLQDGTTIRADEPYLFLSVKEPNRHLVAGYETTMPEYRDRLTDHDINDLVMWMKSLSAVATPSNH